MLYMNLVKLNIHIRMLYNFILVQTIMDRVALVSAR